tara:strand:- start:70 stop:915 length:846 start_codon:yes stop_codon:yes gene_type:complete
LLLRDFFFSIKNVHISFLEKRQIVKLFKVGVVFLYKFIFLDLILYNYFYKKNLDKIYSKSSELYNKKLSYLFEHFSSLRQEHGYEDAYQENLKEIKNRNIDILEIGTAKGDGLASFYFYFPNSILIGVDNNPFRIRYKSKRIRTIYSDISSKKVISNLTNHLSKKFDLIIEDCSHLLVDQIICFVENFKNLKENGIYVVEDLNFPEIHEKYNPTAESINLKVIFNKIINKEKIDTHLINEKQLTYLENNIETIKIFKCKNKKNYLVEGISEYSEIAFVKKK